MMRRKLPADGPAEVQQDEATARRCDEGGSAMRSSSTPRARSHWVLYVLRHFLFALVLLYFALPALMYTSKAVREEMVFLSSLKTPYFANLSDPSLFGFGDASNVYINGRAGRIGAWFIPSNSQAGNSMYLLYLHGNGGSRAVPHRVEAIKVFSQMGFSTLILDYRGFGDSEGTPSERGLVEDAESAYNWLLNAAKGRPVLIWGHSLGSGVGVQLAADLSEAGSAPVGLILEGAFSNIRDGAHCSIFSKPYLFWPYFDTIFLGGIVDFFKSDERVRSVACHILIMHERSDPVIRFQLGQKLYDAARRRPDHTTTFIAVDEGLLHNHIHMYSEIENVLRSFLASVTA